MSQNIDGMVAVAAGYPAAVERWTNTLRKARIPFAVVKCLYDDPSAPTDHAEIWVEEDDAEKARAILLNGSDEDKSSRW